MSKVLRALVLTLLGFTLLACVSVNQPSRKQAAEDKKSLAETNVQLGLAYLQQGKLEIAQEKLLSAIEIEPDLPSAHIALAILNEQFNRPEQADRFYRQAIDLNPEDGVAHNNYGAFLCKQQRYAEAVAHYRKAVKDPIYSTPELAYENAGICAVQSGKVAEAEENFRLALNINPRLSVTLLQMARINHEQKRFLPARAYIQRFEEAGQHDPSSLWLAREIELALKDESRAEDYANQLKQRFPGAEETARLGGKAAGGQQ